VRFRGGNYVLIVIGTFLMAAAVNMVYEPMDMVTGGFSGLAIVIQDVTKNMWSNGIPIWLTNACLNIPLFIVAWFVKGRHFIQKTLFATVCFTVGLYIIPSFDLIYNDYLLAAVFGGTISGIGLGLVFSTSTSTGGTDLLGMLFQTRLKYYSVAQLLFVIDGIIVLLGALVFGLNTALYAVIAVFITSKVIDAMLEGVRFAKMVFIISEQYVEISDEILNRMRRGATALSATGMYSKKDKKVLLCAVSKKEIVKLTDIVAKVDPQAFIIITDAREVMGEGFIEYRQ
jgi:uncharacterized membrane-anchored protein YitT (DUF2179 family)